MRIAIKVARQFFRCDIAMPYQYFYIKFILIYNIPPILITKPIYDLLT